MKILLYGDIFLGGDLDSYWYQDGFSPFGELQDISNNHEIVFANIENTFYRGPLRPFRGGHLFAVEQSIRGLKELNINVASLANNHILDFGVKSMWRTSNLLFKNGIETVGIGNNLKNALREIIVEKEGCKFGFLAFTTNKYYVNAITATKWSVGCAPIIPSLIKDKIKELRSKVDFISIYFHWGYEFLNIPSKEQVKLARECIDWGADIIVGSHPHVIQGYETYKGKLILYSLGNLIFPEYEKVNGEKYKWTGSNNQSLAISITFNKKNEKPYDFEVIPLEFKFPYVKKIENNAKEKVLENIAKWNMSIKNYSNVDPLVINVNREIKIRGKRWRKSFIARLTRRFIIAPMKLIVGENYFEKNKDIR